MFNVLPIILYNI